MKLHDQVVCVGGGRLGSAVAVLVALACSDPWDGPATDSTSRALSSEAPGALGEDEELHEIPIEPIELRHAVAARHSVTCNAEGCDDAARTLRSNVSPAEMDASELRLPLDELAAAEEMRLPAIEQATRAALARASELVDEGRAEERLAVTVYLREERFDFERLRGLRENDAESRSIWLERAAQLAPSQSVAKGLIEGVGGEMGGKLELANIVYAEVPAGRLAELARLGQIVGVEIDGPNRSGADGIARRLALVMNADGLQSWGWDGGHGSTRSGDPRVRFAVIETDAFNAQHASFWDTATGGDVRAAWTLLCTGGTCAGANIPTTASLHGTWVSSVLLSDFEDNQGGTLWTIDQKQRRGGVAPEAEFYYYIAATQSNLAAAINHATANGVDIINMSMSPAGSYCANDSFNGAREAIQAAENAGVLVVVNAGNNGHLGGCTVSSYGAFPDTLTVGGIENVSELSSLSTVPLWTEPGVQGSGRNTVLDNGPVSGGTFASHRFVDLTVTMNASRVATTGQTGTSATSVLGTSFAAPQVAGAAGLLKDWAHDTGALSSGWYGNPYVLRVMLSAMGDGADLYGGGGSGSTSSLNSGLGFGHLRFTLPAFLGSGPWHWAIHWLTAKQGDVFEWAVGATGPEPSAIAGWKFAALADYDWYASAPNMTFQLIDKCPAGGGETLILQAANTAHKARMRMRAGDMASRYHGRCLYVRATVHNASGTFPLYMMDYAYTNSRIYHDM